MADNSMDEANENPFLQPKHVIEAAAAAISQLRNEDGLVPSSHLVVVKQRSPCVFRLRRPYGQLVVPAAGSARIAELLVSNPRLWPYAAIDVQPLPPFLARARVFGVPLGRAIEIVRHRGFQTAHFQVPMSMKQQDELFADLILHVGSGRKEPQIITLEAWQIVGVSNEVFYAHGRIDQADMGFVHLDGATMHLSPEQIDELRYHATKPKGPDYAKHFRVDARFALATGVLLATTYFPIDEIAGEAFELVFSE